MLQRASYLGFGGITKALSNLPYSSSAITGPACHVAFAGHCFGNASQESRWPVHLVTKFHQLQELSSKAKPQTVIKPITALNLEIPMFA